MRLKHVYMFNETRVFLPNVFQYAFMAKNNFAKTVGFCSAGHIDHATCQGLVSIKLNHFCHKNSMDISSPAVHNLDSMSTDFSNPRQILQLSPVNLDISATLISTYCFQWQWCLIQHNTVIEFVKQYTCGLIGRDFKIV